MLLPKSRRLSITRKPLFHRVATRSERQTIPQPRPERNRATLRLPPKPYAELGRRSIFDMIQVRSSTTTKGTDSAMKPRKGDISAEAFAAFAADGSSLRLITLEQ